MKEIEIAPKDKVVIEKQQEQRYQLKHIARTKPYRGHKLFKIDVKTEEVFVAELEVVPFVIKEGMTQKEIKQIPVRKKVIMEEGFHYVSALNEKNAIKKYHKQIRR